MEDKPSPHDEDEVDITRSLRSPTNAGQDKDTQDAPRPLIGHLIEGSTNAELVDMLLQGLIELKRRLGQETAQVAVRTLPQIPDAFSDASVGTFVRLPAVPPSGDEAGEESIWRIVLLSSNPAMKPLGLEIHHTTVIGRLQGEMKPDLDLTPYGAERLGISRRHAMLRPTKDSLLLTDLGSSNGTFHNAERMKPGEPRLLKDNDIVSFAALHLRVKIVSRPTNAHG